MEKGPILQTTQHHIVPNNTKQKCIHTIRLQCQIANVQIK